MKNNKIIALVALVIGVVALAIGFATYTATLNITTAQANVSATDTFSPNINYKTVSGSSPKCWAGTTTGTAISDAGTLSGKTWSGISVPMASGSFVTCVAKVENLSTFTAYLKTISTSSGISCSAVTGGATQGITEACGDITAYVYFPEGGVNSLTITNAAASETLTTNNSISAGGTQNVYLKIRSSGAHPTDGDFKVTIPTISLAFETSN